MTDAKHKVLIVEDEEMIAELLTDALTIAGFECVTAHNGAMGLEMVEKEKPDLVISDILMPVMDGVTMVEKMRANDEFKDVPVIVMSNLDDERTASEMRKIPHCDFVAKTNWDPRDLVSRIHSKIEKKHD